MFYLKLPPLNAIIEAWEARPEYVDGKTYNVSSGGVVLGVTQDLISTVIGSATLGVPGNDVDFGVVSDLYVDSAEGFEDFHITHYANGVSVCSEFREVGVYSFMALPLSRARLDMREYAWASIVLNAIGREHWSKLKRINKVMAYQIIGVSTQNDDGSFPFDVSI